MVRRPAPAQPEALTTLTIIDYAGITRGRSVTRTSFDKSKGPKTCGWVPANMSLTSYDIIADPNPWGSAGDLRLLADRSARYTCWPAGAATPLDLVMSDIVETDGTPWVCCPRSLLKGRPCRLQGRDGTEFIASFEQEFQVLAQRGHLPLLRRVGAAPRDPFGPDIVRRAHSSGRGARGFRRRVWARPVRITTPPTDGLAAADRAVVIREVIREIAARQGWRASFAPKTAVDGVGNGVHIHFSFAGANGRAAAFDPRGRAACPNWPAPLRQAFSGIFPHSLPSRQPRPFPACA